VTDKTRKLEQNIARENKPSIKHLFRLWVFVFSSTKVISCIYLGLFILLSLLRPTLAFMWGNYITRVEGSMKGDKLLPAICLLIGYFIIGYAADLIESYMAASGDGDIEQLDLVQANRQQELMHSKMFKKLSTFSSEYFEIAKLSDVSDQVFNFVGNGWSGVNRQVMLSSYIVIAKIVSVLSIAASLYVFNPWLCIIVLIAPLPTLWTSTIGERLRFKFIKDNTKLKRRINYFQGLMLSPASKEMKTLGLYDFFYEKWKIHADEYTLKEKKMIRGRSALEIANSFVVNLANVGSMVFAIVLFTMGQLSLGALGAVISLVGTLVDDSSQLLMSAASFLAKKNNAAQFFDLMDLPEQKDEGKDMGTFDVLCAKGLKYRYPLTERYVLDGVDMTIKKGEKVAFVGENGEGKTTFVKLITGLIQPSDGELTINGIAAEELNPIDRYRNQSTVVQNPARYFTFTVRDNVFLGDTTKVRDEDVIDAALDFAGFEGQDKDALLGKDIGGTELSGGQWQKLAIARAAYRNRDFIILDEPTSNLDPLAETEVFQKYIALAKDKTVIFVTHRISVAALADRIVVFKGGKVIQDGTHEELISQEGEYSRLYREQAKWYNR